MVSLAHAFIQEITEYSNVSQIIDNMSQTHLFVISHLNVKLLQNLSKCLLRMLVFNSLWPNDEEWLVLCPRVFCSSRIGGLMDWVGKCSSFLVPPWDTSAVCSTQLLRGLQWD